MAKKLDKNLIFLQSENCRARIKDMAAALKKSSPLIKYSINHLEKEGIIKSPYCVFDYSYFGLILFKVYFKGGYIGEKDKAKIISALSDNNYVISIYELAGEYDLAIEMLSPNPSRFNKELKKIIDEFPTLNNHKIALNMVTYIYPPTFLLEDPELAKRVKSYIVIGGDRSIEQFDKSEMSIIKSLLENPRVRFTSLAKKSGMNVSTAKKILRKLKEKKIIRGYKYTIDTGKLNIYKYRIFLKLHNMSQEKEEQLKETFLMTKGITAMNKIVGDWNLELDVESLDKTTVRQLIIKIREDFKDVIENFNIMEHYDTYKKKFLPSYLFFQEPVI
jgi:DNA-binding Lrp family transcriptional regulator